MWASWSVMLLLMSLCTGLCCRIGDYSSFTEGEGRYCAGEATTTSNVMENKCIFLVVGIYSTPPIFQCRYCLPADKIQIHCL